MNQIKKYSEITFESIKHIDEYGDEYWLARELQKPLEYKEWRKFEGVIEKAKLACENSNNDTKDHFVGADKMIKLAKGATRKVNDINYQGMLVI